jgi:two-component system response regulator
MQAPSDELVIPVLTDGPAPGLCVLVVEDDDADVYLIHRALADNPAIGAIVLARDGVEALALIDRGVVAPDLALIDLHMPRMDGFGLLFAFAGRPEPRFPMVVLTSSSSPSDAVRSRLRRAIRVVTKPDTITEMYAVLKATIEGVCHPNARNNSPSLRAPEYPMENPYNVGLRRISADGGLE